MKINRETQIGLLVTIALAMLIWGISFLKGNNLFSNDQIYYAVYEKVDGLSESAPVLVKGYNIGRVSSIELNQNIDNQLVIQMAIHKKYEIPQNTIAQIQSTDFIGGKAIVLMFPKEIAGYHESKDTLKGSYDEGLDALLEKAELTADEMVNSIDSILHSINELLDTESRKHLKSTFESLDRITYELHATLEQDGALHHSMENLKLFSDAMASSVEDVSGISSNLETFTDSLSKLDINETVNEFNQVLTQSKNMLETVNSAKGTAGKLVYDDSLYINLKNVTHSLDRLLIDLQENPKRYVHFSLFGGKGQ